MRMGEWEDAERDLLEALGKDAKSADTLANLVTVRALAAAAAAAVAGVVAATCSAFCTCHLLRVCMCPFFAVCGDLW
jgi:Coatomer epsilon subunit